MSSSTERFVKSADCPASDELVDLCEGRVGIGDTGRILTHLDYCDFCHAEVSFYELFPPVVDGVSVFEEIPQPLYQLAKALLTNDKGGELSRLLKTIE
ncbi:MAG TPA: hypothetical protein VNA22_05955 [Pyrinomonadaceae bacterium]|nr:hypothetical protein [Pyrinomonadaceae bacterium]